jgi:hypothetical protein
MTPDLLQLVTLGYLEKHARGHAAARTQARIAADLRDLGLQATARDVRRRPLADGCG